MNADKAPREHQNPTPQKSKNLILVFTGEGKGKSTASFGTLFRALGWGWKAGVVQFIKGDWETGEEKAARLFPDKVDWYHCGEGFTWETQNFEEDKQCALKTWDKALEWLEDSEHQLVILDEILCCLDYGFLEEDEIIKKIKSVQNSKHIVLTGRGASEKILALADLATEMKKLKHPYDQGILAQKGIDY